MKVGLWTILGPMIGALVLALIVQQTSSALHQSGTWTRRDPTRRPLQNPYAGLESLLALGSVDSLPASLRDPFAYRRQPAAPVTVRRPATGPPTPAPVSRPVLTSIVWSEQPQATVRWNGREWSVRVGLVFDEFVVTGITREQVTLQRGNESIVLRLPRQGD